MELQLLARGQAMPKQTIEESLTASVKRQLLGKRIVAVRYMSAEEMGDLGWSQRSIVLQLDDGNLLYPSCDDEGNDAGALFTNDELLGTIPTLR